MTRELSEEDLRRRACHGWAFRAWTAEEEAAIRAFLALETDEPPAAYAAAWKYVRENWRTR